MEMELKKLVDEQLKSGLIKQTGGENLSLSRDFFATARKICTDNNLPSYAYRKFERLVCGNPNLPVIIIPVTEYDEMPYEKLVEQSPALELLKRLLEFRGLSLNPRIILSCQGMRKITIEEFGEIFKLCGELKRRLEPRTTARLKATERMNKAAFELLRAIHQYEGIQYQLQDIESMLAEQKKQELFQLELNDLKEIVMELLRQISKPDEKQQPPSPSMGHMPPEEEWW